MTAISLRNVIKRYGHGAKANQVIHGVSADVKEGEFVVIVGPQAAANPPCCAWWPASRKSRPAKSPLAGAW